MNYNKIAIVSDIHLGSHACHCDEFAQFLEKIHKEFYDLLIINGDLFENMEIRLSKKHWNILSKLRKMSNDMKVVWVKGNHDEPSPEVVSHILGIDICDEFVFESENKKIFCLHGDVFDDFISKHPKLTSIANSIYKFMQRFSKWKWLAKFLKRNSKTFLRCKDKVKNSAIKLLRHNEYDYVCCGHVHYAEADNINSYYNSGSWTESPCTYIEISNDKIELKQFVYENIPCSI